MKKEIKVYEGRNKKGDPVPQIRLQGQWLEQIGFSIGSVMEIEYESDRLILNIKND